MSLATSVLLSAPGALDPRFHVFGRLMVVEILRFFFQRKISEKKFFFFALLLEVVINGCYLMLWLECVGGGFSEISFSYFFWRLCWFVDILQCKGLVNLCLFQVFQRGLCLIVSRFERRSVLLQARQEREETLGEISLFLCRPLIAAELCTFIWFCSLSLKSSAELFNKELGCCLQRLFLSDMAARTCEHLHTIACVLSVYTHLPVHTHTHTHTHTHRDRSSPALNPLIHPPPYQTLFRLFTWKDKVNK